VKRAATQQSACVVSSDGLALRCTLIGAGRDVLLLHAGGETRDVWRPAAARLAERGFRAISVDQRAHGETRGAVPDSLDAYGWDVRALVGAFDAPLVLVGASLGGLALLLALTDPATAARVRAVVLVDVVPNLDADRARTYLRGIEAKLQRRWHWPLNEDILGRVEELQRAAASLRVPVHLIRGSHGNLDPAALDHFLRLVPSATLSVVNGAGHLVARDRPHELARALLDFIELCE
jgi:pimeloyl-ACP methyl ester carboxylesterase